MSFSAVSYEVSLPLSKGRILTPWACRQAGSLGYPRGDSRGVAELRILMISALEVWALAGQGGAASLYKTLEAYGRRGACRRRSRSRSRSCASPSSSPCSPAAAPSVSCAASATTSSTATRSTASSPSASSADGTPRPQPPPPPPRRPLPGHGHAPLPEPAAEPPAQV